jgi:hypothetical protein
MYAFNWKRAVERYSDELSQIVAELIVMAGLQGVDFVDTLPRRLYFRILVDPASGRIRRAAHHPDGRLQAGLGHPDR